MALDRRAVTAPAKNLDVATAQLCRFEDCLTAAAAGRANDVVPAADDSHPRDLVEPELVLGSSQRALLRADAEPVTGILHVGARHDLAVDRFNGAADVEVRIG